MDLPLDVLSFLLEPRENVRASWTCTAAHSVLWGPTGFLQALATLGDEHRDEEPADSEDSKGPPAWIVATATCMEMVPFSFGPITLSVYSWMVAAALVAVETPVAARSVCVQAPCT